MKWHKRLKHRITCIFGIRSKNQSRNSVNEDDTAQNLILNNDESIQNNPLHREEQNERIHSNNVFPTEASIVQGSGARNRHSLYAERKFKSKYTIQDDYPDSLNPFASECSPKIDTDYPSTLNPFEGEEIIVDNHTISGENIEAEVERENNNYPASLNPFDDNQDEIDQNEPSQSFSPDNDRSPAVESENNEENNPDSQLAASIKNINCNDHKVPSYDKENPVETPRYSSENSSVLTVPNNLPKTRRYRKKYPAPKPPQSICHMKKEEKEIINSPKREYDLKEEQRFEQSLKNTTDLSSPDPKQCNNFASLSSESHSKETQYREENERKACSSKVKYAGANINRSFRNSINRAQDSLSENNICSKKSEYSIKMLPSSKLQYSNSSPELISEAKVLNAIFIEEKDVVKNMKQKSPLIAVSTLPQETIGKIEIKAPMISVSVKSNHEPIVKVHRSAPPVPNVKISHQQSIVSSVLQPETAENIKTRALPVSIKSNQEKTLKIRRRAPPHPPAVNISKVKETQAPKKTRMRKLQKFFTNIFMKN